MSGGVDSSVTAALLVDAGYDVTGVYMKNWSQDLPGMRCPWAEDLADAKRVAVKLGIDLKVYDFETDYRDKVVEYMLEEYKAGRTPNPDIMCNQEVKFKLFLETALADGADMIATGHYARVANNESFKLDQYLKNTYPEYQTIEDEDLQNELLQANDVKKDQTYFLYRVTGEAMSKTLFPLGGFSKPEVRKIAESKNLITAHKKDSVGVCFVGQVGMEEFLSEYIETSPGKIIEKETDKTLGWHNGALFYTIGQRHGLDIGGGLPFYVIEKDIEKNIVYVSRNLEQKDLWTKKINLKDVHWINNAPVIGQTYQIRTRHQAPLIKAKLVSLDNKNLSLLADEELRAVTAGQSVVIYDERICLGGGIVK